MVLVRVRVMMVFWFPSDELEGLGRETTCRNPHPPVNKLVCMKSTFSIITSLLYSTKPGTKSPEDSTACFSFNTIRLVHPWEAILCNSQWLFGLNVFCYHIIRKCSKFNFSAHVKLAKRKTCKTQLKGVIHLKTSLSRTHSNKSHNQISDMRLYRVKFHYMLCWNDHLHFLQNTFCSF